MSYNNKETSTERSVGTRLSKSLYGNSNESFKENQKENLKANIRENIREGASTLTKILLILLLGFLVMNSVGCSTETMDSTEVTQNAIHQDYDVSYSVSDNSTYMNAQFRAGGWSGTTLALTDPSHVKANAEIMSLNSSWLGTSYERSVSIQTANIRIPRTSSYQVVLTLEPIRPGEQVYVTISQNGTQAQSASVRGESGVAVFSVADLAKFELGTATLNVERTYNQSLSEATAKGGSISYRYNVPSVSIVLG